MLGIDVVNGRAEALPCNGDLIRLTLILAGEYQFELARLRQAAPPIRFAGVNAVNHDFGLGCRQFRQPPLGSPLWAQPKLHSAEPRGCGRNTLGTL